MNEKKYHTQAKDKVRGPVNARLKVTFVMLFSLGLVYGILVGKYQFPPYKIISNFKTMAKSSFDISLLEHFESITPKGKKESINVLEKQNKIKDNAVIIKPVLDRILPIIYSSKKASPSFDIILPPLLGYTVNFSVLKGKSLKFYIHNKYKVKADVYWLGRKKNIY